MTGPKPVGTCNGLERTPPATIEQLTKRTDLRLFE
jgi:hypothetical protein